jgi:ATP-binding cassette subfamily B protein
MSVKSIPAELGFDLRAVPVILGRILRIALRYRWRFILATVTSLLATAFNLAMPRLLGLAVDQAHTLLRGKTGDTADALSSLTTIALLLVAAATLRGLTQMVSGFQSEYIGQCVGRDLRIAFFEKLQRIGFDYHDRVHSGDLITRGMLDLEGVRGFIETGLQRLLSLVLLLVIGSALMAAQDPFLTLLAVSFVPVASWRAARMGLLLRLAWTRLQERMSVLTRVMEENLQGMRVVRSFASKNFEMEKFDLAGDSALALSNQRILIRSRSMALINFSYYLAMALVLWVGGHLVLRGALTIGQLTEFLTLMTLLQAPVRQIGMIMNASARAVSSGKRLFEVLDLEPTIRDRKGARDLVLTKGVLRFESVRFSYAAEGARPPILDGISFRVGPGQTLGIVGPSGSGKSTIALLIPRFYDVTGGRITLDDQDIRDLTLDSLRNAVGLVQQDTFLFDDAIDRNVAYADPDADEHAVVDATATAQIHDHVANLPLGYRTRVGERGVSLSGGQRQRLSIARGMVPNPAVLIFDDSTSAVDAATEHLVRRALQRATQSQATIIISHRLGSLMHADEIIVLDNGRIIERGKHETLIEANGHYAALYRAQSQGKPLHEQLGRDERISA